MGWYLDDPAAGRQFPSRRRADNSGSANRWTELRGKLYHRRRKPASAKARSEPTVAWTLYWQTVRPVRFYRQKEFQSAYQYTYIFFHVSSPLPEAFSSTIM